MLLLAAQLQKNQVKGQHWNREVKNICKKIHFFQVINLVNLLSTVSF